MTLPQNVKQCAWLTSPLPDSLCDLLLLSTKSFLRLPLVLAAAASPRLAHLLAGHAVHEQVCVIIPNYCHHTMLALYHLITTGATLSLNTRHMAELKEVCSLLGFGQVARDKKDGDRVTQPQEVVSTSPVSMQLGSVPSVASVPSQQQSGIASAPGGEEQEPPTTVTTADNDDLLLANTRGEVSKISQPAVLSQSHPAPSTEPCAAISEREEGVDDNCKEEGINSLKSRLRSSAVAASKKLAETAGCKRMKKYSHPEIASRQQQLAQCQTKSDQPALSVSNIKVADPAVQQNVIQKSSGLDINSNDCREEKYKVRSKDVRNHGNVLFKLRPRSVTKKDSGRRSLKVGGPESLEIMEQPSKSPTPSVIFKGDQVVDRKESEGNFVLTKDAPLKCSTRKKRSTSSYTKLYCKKQKLNIPQLELKATNPKPLSQSMLSQSSSLSCPECLKSSPSQSSIYPDQTSYKRHLTKMHFLQKICDLFPGPYLVCHLCTSSSKLPSKDLLAMHLGTSHSLCYSFVQEGFSCGICDQTFQHGNKFKMHLFTHYRTQLIDEFKEVIQCPFCAFWSMHTLPRHMGVFHGLVFKYYDPASFMLKTPGNPDKSGQNEGLVEVITLD